MKNRNIIFFFIFIFLTIAMISYSLYKLFSGGDLNATNAITTINHFQQANKALTTSIKNSISKPSVNWDNTSVLIKQERKTIIEIKTCTYKKLSKDLDKILISALTDANDYYINIERLKGVVAELNFSKTYLPALFFKASLVLKKNKKNLKREEVFQNLMSDVNLYITTGHHSLVAPINTLNKILINIDINQNDLFRNINFHVNQLTTLSRAKAELMASLEKNKRSEYIDQIFDSIIIFNQTHIKNKIIYQQIVTIGIYIIVLLLIFTIYQLEKQKKIHRKRMEDELSMAQAVQETLFPPTYYNDEKVEVSGLYRAASECGGDWWYYNKINNNIYFWIGDATGHGAAAALITSAARCTVAILESEPEVSTDQMMSVLNNAIYETSRGKMIMTFFIAKLNMETNELTYTNASHEPPLVLNKNDIASHKNILFLDSNNGSALGARKHSKFNQTTVKLDNSNAIFFYTDGLTETKNLKGVNLGVKRLIKLVTNCYASSENLKDCTVKLEEELSKINPNSLELHDDLTYFFVNLK